MINNNFTIQPHLTNELAIEPLKQKEKIEKDDQNINRTCQDNICETSVINQINKPETTPEKLSTKTPSKLEHYSVSTPGGIIWHEGGRIAYESSSAKVLPANVKNSKEPSIIKISATLESVDCLISKDKQWLSFLQDFFRQTPIQSSSIDRILTLQTEAGKIEEIIFLLEDRQHNKGYGNLNLFIEFLRNFVRLSPGTLHRIRFSGCEYTLGNKLPNLISGLPDRYIDDAAIHGDITDRLSSSETEPKKIFGIPYIVEPGQPKEFISKNTLQIYTHWD
ncbi:hypothetical protein [Endozoicomonas sp. SESOKO1]|uniref:hypothetical protein n=1 Tax=Endozoicomonas sp. SESOKO1 TaxID=2828742 RepID=UPI0021497929|nr:hypothetical protein [Endozoicomonas sp. SESOKO1]